jgi:hypothetical protein
MTDLNEALPFDQAPDAVLGDRLRTALDGAAPETFLARLRLAVAASRESSWEVLARWAPVGMAAAAAAAAVVWVLLRPVADPGHPAQLASVPSQMELTMDQSELDLLATSILEDR